MTLFCVFMWWLQPSKIKCQKYTHSSYSYCKHGGVWIYPKFGCEYFGYVHNDPGINFVQWKVAGKTYPYAVGYDKSWGWILQKAQ